MYSQEAAVDGVDAAAVRSTPLAIIQRVEP